LGIVILGLSITSSWGNGHATNYRALVRALHRRGHEVTFLERDVPWYAAHRDVEGALDDQTELYTSMEELRDRFEPLVREADVVIVGSYVPDGIELARWVTSAARGVTAFYDIDTPVTVAALDTGACGYLAPELIPRFDLYLSFTGGPMLKVIERRYGSPHAHAFHCFVDADEYRPAQVERRWDLGYLGTYSDDRQPALEELLLEPARRASHSQSFVVAGPLYPESISWPENVERIDHVAPADHSAFYNAQRLTLNVTRADMVRAGWSPSVRLFEAAACGVPVISDWWEGLDSFFRPGVEIFVARTASDIEHHLATLDEDVRHAVGDAARDRVLRAHTGDHRAAQLEELVTPLSRGTCTA